MNNTTTVARAKFITAQETAFGSITSSFTAIGTPFTVSFCVLYVQNFTDQIMDFSISYDGATTTFSLAPNGIICSDMIANQVQVSAGESAWVKYRSTPPASGFVQVSAISPAT